MRAVGKEIMPVLRTKQKYAPLVDVVPFIINAVLISSFRTDSELKKRMIMMILGIAGCTALVVAGFGVRDSVANIANNQYNLVMKYHINATYTEEITSDMLKEIQDSNPLESQA